MMKEIIEKGNLRIIRDGTIYANLGDVRGVNHSEPGKTLVKYASSYEIPEMGKFHTEFVFHGNLPEDIEGKEFAFAETYVGTDKTQIPTEQYLAVFGENLTFEDFIFPKN